MSASDHLQPQQLAMLMPADEVLATHALGDARSQGPKDRALMLGRKSRQNDRYGNPDMAEPITISHDPWPGARGRPVVYDGHHRLAEGVRTGAWLPLQHIDASNWKTL